MRKYKRIHLFEIEDQSWFPNWLRDCMTKALSVMHNLVKTNKVLPDLLAKTLRDTNSNKILDLCSGGGGPMIEAIEILRKEHGFVEIQLQMTDLFPHQKLAAEINGKNDKNIQYSTKSTDATNIPSSEKGLRTMICSFHHMKPEIAIGILKNAKDSRQPILIYEMSDNKAPAFLTFISIPITFIVCLFITFKVRPMTVQQIVFTYLIPIIPLCFAWDGAVSNVRTYTLKDMEELLKDLKSDDYAWETGLIPGKPGGKLYLIGKPV